MTLPVQTQAVVDDRGLLTPPWRRALADLERRVTASSNDGLAANIAAIATALGSPDGTVSNIPPQADNNALIVGLEGILTEGTIASGRVTVRLVDLEDTGEGAGLYKITRDAKGRIEGTASATTSDLPEGSNLYFTDERAQDAVGAAIAAGTGDGVTLAYDDANGKISATNTDKGTVARTAHEAAVDPHPQYTTTAEAQAIADAKVEDTITDGVTAKAPSQNAVFDALAGKAGLAANNTFTGSNTFVSPLDLQRTGTPAQKVSLIVDGIGTTVRSYSDPANAKPYNFDATTDSSNTAPTGGSCFVRFNILGVPMWTISTTELRPDADNTANLGTSSRRAANGYITNLRPGAGSVIWTSGIGTPEGVIVAPVGSLYTRTNGGAGTTLYVKESGAGNTGWVAK